MHAGLQREVARLGRNSRDGEQHRPAAAQYLKSAIPAARLGNSWGRTTQRNHAAQHLNTPRPAGPLGSRGGQVAIGFQAAQHWINPPPPGPPEDRRVRRKESKFTAQHSKTLHSPGSLGFSRGCARLGSWAAQHFDRAWPAARPCRGRAAGQVPNLDQVDHADQPGNVFPSMSIRARSLARHVRGAGSRPCPAWRLWSRRGLEETDAGRRAPLYLPGTQVLLPPHLVVYWC